jgi:tetratricopeptide (TPR) repeat protein
MAPGFGPIGRQFRGIVMSTKHTMIEHGAAKLASTDGESEITLAQHFQQAVVLHQQGKLDVAQSLYEQILAFQNQHADAWHMVGLIAQQRGNPALCVQLIDKAIDINASKYDMFFNRAIALEQLQRFEEAALSYEIAIFLKPEYAQAHNNRAVVLQALGRYEDAVRSCDAAIAVEPKMAQAYTNRGNALKELDLPQEAMVSYDQAIAIRPHDAMGYNNRGLLCMEQGQIGAAREDFEKAISLRPDYATAHVNYGNACKDLLRFDQALQSYQRAMDLDPENADAQVNASMLLLRKGDFKNGWTLYESRWKATSFKSYRLQTNKPQYVGPKKTQRLLLWGEQGVGDEIMFASLFGLARGLADQILVKTDARLVPLFSRSFPDFEFFPRETQIPEDRYDHHLPTGSLCGFFLHDYVDFEKIRIPYLKVSNAYESGLADILSKEKSNCGISWRSFNASGDRTLEICDFLLMLPLEKINLINLQYGEVNSELKIAKTKLCVKIQNHPDVDNRNNLDGLAEIINACDVVASIDCITIHLAGALGKKTELILSESSEWRWFSHLRHSLWYPTVIIKYK